MTELDAALRERILSARALPSPPVVTARLVELCEDPDAGINDVIDVLSTDAALVARLMRLANSPIYARRRRTENLRQAVTLLGFDVVLTASLSLTLTASRNASGSRSPAFRKRWWTRSVHAAACSQLLAENVDNVDPTDAFLAALLQDIGVQVVDRIEPDVYDTCDPDGSHVDLIAAELDVLGADHAALGAELLREWRLPDLIVNAVLHSHQPGHPDAPTMAAVIASGGLIADGFSGDGSGLRAAFDMAHELLGIGESAFTMTIEYIATVLPDLAAILDADAPDQETLTEMAEEAILMRQMQAQTTAAQLHEEIENLRIVAEELKTQTGIDALTGLSNRRRLDELMDEEFSAAKKNGFPMSILFIDLDDFKLVNDRYGHGVGDHLLMQSSRRISGAVRDGDFVGRFGGEEFIVILPGCDRESSNVVAQRLVDTFQSRPFPFNDGVELVQTASVGVATLDDISIYDSSSELIHAADLALYVAKRNGKNQFQRGDTTDDVRDNPGEVPVTDSSAGTSTQTADALAD
jgi:diguanylate cyclase (GGDEF)-like protein